MRGLQRWEKAGFLTYRVRGSGFWPWHSQTISVQHFHYSLKKQDSSSTEPSSSFFVGFCDFTFLETRKPSQSNYFNVIPPGGGVSLTPKQAFPVGEGVGTKFYCLNLQKNDSPSLWREKGKVFSEQVGSFCWKPTGALFRDFSSLQRTPGGILSSVVTYIES